MRSFLIALSFFTRIPIVIKGKVSDMEFFNSMKLIPLVGLVIGILLFVLSQLLCNFSIIRINALLTIIVFIYITGGLHLDGLADTMDALMSARDKKQIFEIMKDPRLGTFGGISLIVIILGYYSLIETIYEQEYFILLLFFPVVGRISALIIGALSNACPESGGLAKGFCSAISKPLAFFYSVILLICLLVLKYNSLIIGYILTISVLIIEVLYFKEKLGGITGDQIGFTIEFSQVIFLVVTLYVNTMFGELL